MREDEIQGRLRRLRKTANALDDTVTALSFMADGIRGRDPLHGEDVEAGLNRLQEALLRQCTEIIGQVALIVRGLESWPGPTERPAAPPASGSAP